MAVVVVDPVELRVEALKTTRSTPLQINLVSDPCSRQVLGHEQRGGNLLELWSVVA
jgi:hypothetical protein